MIKGLIFDLDGTLINSIDDIHYSLNLALKAHGYKEKDLKTTKANIGNGFKRLIMDSLPEINDENIIDEINKTYTKFYSEHYHDKTYSYDGVYELLKELNKRNIKIAVNSNKKDEYTKNLMNIIFPDIKFVAVFGERKGIETKPNPKSALEIIDMMKLDKDEVLYVGDSEIDIRTAKNAGLKSVGCLWGFRNKETLKNEGVDTTINKPEELLKYLKIKI